MAAVPERGLARLAHEYTDRISGLDQFFFELAIWRMSNYENWSSGSGETMSKKRCVIRPYWSLYSKKTTAPILKIIRSAQSADFILRM